MNEPRNRGVADILIAVVDGLKGFPEAISAVFPEPSASFPPATQIEPLLHIGGASFSDGDDAENGAKLTYRSRAH
jgi:hypothetical protein